MVYKVDSEGLLTSINSPLTNSFKIFPNPATDNLHIVNVNGMSLNNQCLSVRLIDLLGNVIIRQKFTFENEFTLNVAQVQAGIYLILLEDDQGHSICPQKVVII